MYLKSLLLVGLTLLLFSCTPTYIVTFQGGLGGTVSDLGGEYDEGTSISVNAIPNEGYEFQGWSDGSMQNPKTIIVSESLNLIAQFSKQKFLFVITTQGEGTVNTIGADNQGNYEYGDSARFEAVPSIGWEFDSWSGDVSGNTNPLTITIKSPQTITAVFKRQKFDLNVTVEGEGTVKEEVIVQPSQYDYETLVRITSIPDEGWEFDSWSGDVSGNTNPLTITIKSPQTITAVFVQKDTDGDGVFDLDDLCNDTPVGSTVNANGCHDIIYLSDNGVTIKSRGTALVGDVQELNGIQYKVVSETMLREMISNNEDVTKVVTTLVTNMSSMFAGRVAFKQDISKWDVSNVTSMRGMFGESRSFNADISNWDVSMVENMEGMFYRAESFNQPISNWNVSKVLYIKEIFREASLFNQDISNWDMSNKTWISGMFYGAISFNQPLNNWDVSNTHDFSHLFRDATAFNQPINNWNVKKAGNNGGMDYMFHRAESFNQDISMWCVSQIFDIPKFFSSGNIQEIFIPIWGTCPLIDDDDLDGVVNYYDDCPNTEEGEEVDEHGCSENQVDNNNDGVPDSLEGDSDNDGVIDFYDECPNTPSGTAVDSKGCSVVDQVFLFSGAVSTVVLNSNVSGTISFSIRNNLDEPIQLESLKVYDGDTGVLRASSEKDLTPNLFPTLSTGQSHSLQASFNSFIYLPMYYWRFTYKGQVYEVSKRWSLTSGQSKPPKDSNGSTLKEWDKKVVSFQITVK